MTGDSSAAILKRIDAIENNLLQLNSNISRLTDSFDKLVNIFTNLTQKPEVTLIQIITKTEVMESIYD